MGSTYTRQSSTEIVDGEVIQASDFNNEFEQLVSAFAVSTGHSHDGTTAEGGPVTKLLGTAITIGDGTSGTDIAVTFDGETSDGVLTWMEDEDHFKFSDDIVIDGTKRLYLNDEGGEYIYGDGTDLYLVSGADINIPANIGMTFGNDGEKIEGDGTDLTISGNNINLTATADVVIPADVGITFGSGEKIEGDSTDLTVTSGADINLTATSDVNIPSGVGVTFGDDGEKIEGDGTNLTISTSNNVTVDAAADIILDAGGADVTLKDDGTTFGSLTNSSGELVIKSGSTPTTAMTFSGANVTGAGTYTGGGTMTTGGNIVIPDAGNIGSASDTDAIAISSTGVVTFSQSPVFPDGGVPLADLDIDGATDIGADLTTSDLIIVDDGAGGTNRKAALSRVNTLVQTAGGFPLTALDIDGGTDIGEAIVDADLFIIDNGAGGTNRKTAASRLKTYIGTTDLTSIGSNIVPDGSGTRDIGTTSAEWNDIYLADNSAIYFGSDQEITLTHAPDDGLILKHVGTGDGKEPSLTFQAGDNDIAVNDVLGSIFFQAPDEGAGTDAVLVAAGIEAVSEGNFAADNNATKLSFKTAASELASEKMSLSSAGLLTVADDIVFKDGGTIGVTSATDAMTVSSGGIVTFKDDILIKDGGTIGSASAATAITVASTGIVTFVDDILIKDGGTIGSASDADAITIASTGVVTFSQVPLLPNDTIETADIQDNAVTLAKMAGLARGKLIIGDASGDPTALAAGSANYVLTSDGTDISWAEAASSADPSSADGDSLGTASAEWSDLFLADGGIIYFGNDQDVTVTHDPDDGLFLKSIATGDNNPFVLTLQTGETDIAQDDVIGQIDFQAPDEGTGTDAILVAAGIAAVSEGDFSSSNNATKLSFKTGASEAAAEKMSLSSAGLLTISDDLVLADGKTIGNATTADLIHLAAAETVFNEGSADIDFRVESNDNTSMLKVDAANNAVGIGHGPGNTEFLAVGPASASLGTQYDLIKCQGKDTGQIIANQKTTVGTSATTIATVTIGGVGGILAVVTGGSDPNTFTDLVLFHNSGGTPATISSVVKNSPPARTYSTSGSSLQLAYGSGSHATAAWFVTMRSN